MVCRTVCGNITACKAVDLYVTLHTAAGPVRCQDRKRCLFVDSDEDEFIIGKPLLIELGIDIYRQLKMLATQAVDPDKDDSFELTDAPELRVRVEASEAEVIESMITMAAKRGMPKANLEKLRAAGYKFDIWHLMLGNDPPAREIRWRSG
ncbi:hypothetical protein Gpo141_00013877 [Globisporangium polare]